MEHGRSDSSSEEDLQPQALADLNKSITGLGCTPVKLHGVRLKDRPHYAKRKVVQASTALEQRVTKVLNVPDDEQDSESDDSCTGCDDLRRLVGELKIKVNSATRQEKIKLLTLAPASWSQEKVADEFGVSSYLVKESRRLKKKNGILSEPEKKCGRVDRTN